MRSAWSHMREHVPSRTTLMPSISNFIPSTMNAHTPRFLLRSQLLHNGKKSVVRQPYRYFSCSIRPAQEQRPSPNHSQDAPRTTHFGFETVAEALKEQK